MLIIAIYDIDGLKREITIAATTIPGFGRHLFSALAANEKGVTNIISGNPVIKTSVFEMELLHKGGRNFYLDMAIKKKISNNIPGSQHTDHTRDDYRSTRHHPSRIFFIV